MQAFVSTSCVWISWNKPSNRSGMVLKHTKNRHTCMMTAVRMHLHLHPAKLLISLLLTCNSVTASRWSYCVYSGLADNLPCVCVCVCVSDCIFLFQFLFLFSPLYHPLSLLSSLFPLSSDLSIVLSASGPSRLFGVMVQGSCLTSATGCE